MVPHGIGSVNNLNLINDQMQFLHFHIKYINVELLITLSRCQHFMEAGHCFVFFSLFAKSILPSRRSKSAFITWQNLRFAKYVGSSRPGFCLLLGKIFDLPSMLVRLVLDFVCMFVCLFVIAVFATVFNKICPNVYS